MLDIRQTLKAKAHVKFGETNGTFKGITLEPLGETLKNSMGLIIIIIIYHHRTINRLFFFSLSF